MSSLMSGELQATCSALGYRDKDRDEYCPEPDCIYALKDLIRFLKHDDDTNKTRRELGSLNIMETDLVPLLKTCWEDKTLFDIIIRLLVNLTNPALLLYEEIPTDRILRNHYLEIISDLQRYKQAFADNKVFAILTNKLGELLKLDWEHRQEEDRLVIERILVLVRNVLHIPPDPQQEKRTDNDATVHDQVLWALHLSGMEDILLYIASSKEENHLCAHVLEIISLMFREQDPSQLAAAGAARSQSEKQKDTNELSALWQREKAEKKKKVAQFSGVRHSQFGGSFVVQNVKSLSDRQLISHAPLTKAVSISFDRNKSVSKRPRHRMLAQDVDVTRRSTLSIRLFLKEFCVVFLQSAYNSIMNVVKDSLVRQKSDDHDETYYMWALRFFMAFNRAHKFKVDLVSETISLSTFHFLQTEIDKNLEMMRMEKKKISLWARRLHFSVRAYAELINTLTAMDKVKDPKVRESSRVLKGNIFYLTEYRELPLSLLASYDELKMPKSYLKDVIEMAHVFLKMLHELCKASSHLIVREKKKKSQKKKKSKKAPQVVTPPLETDWENIANDISATIQGQLPLADDVQPFDAASDRSMENQCVDAMRKIHSYLRNGNVAQAVAFFRAAREVWPEENAFGTSDIQPEAEFVALREIFFAPLPDLPQETVVESVIEDNESQEEEEEAEIPSTTTTEHEFNYQDFVQRFASPKVLRPYSILLRNFRNNSYLTNHCIARMFHRIAWDLKRPGLLFQATIFHTFQKLFKESANDSYKELIKLGKFILEKFFDMAQNNKKIFMELLFWKGSAEVYEMQYGYGTHEAHGKKTKQLWSEEEEDELQALYEEFKDGASDVVDSILDHLIDKTKTRRQVIAQLKRQNLITDAKQLTKRPMGQGKRASSAPWSEEEEVQLRHLFTLHKDSDDVVHDIELGLQVKRSKRQVIEQILKLGLVASKKELYKKRKSKKDTTRKGKGKHEEASLDDEESSQSEINSDEDDVNELDLTSLIITPELKSSVEWLCDTLKENSNDRADGDMEPVAIVPISEEQEDAINNSIFMNIMRKLSLAPPEEGQEAYWRIPRHLTSNMLNKRVWFLERILSGDLGDDDQVMDKEKSLTVLKEKRERSKKKRQEVNLADQSSERREILSDEENDIRLSEIKKSQGKIRNVLDSSDDDDESPLTNLSNLKSAEESIVTSGCKNETSVINKTRRILQIEDSSDEDDDTVCELIPQLEEQSDSIECNKSRTKRRLLDEDDESDDKDVVSQSAKRVCYVSEESDEEIE